MNNGLRASIVLQYTLFILHYSFPGMSDYRLSKEAVLRALSTVEEPDLKRDIVSLNMVKDVTLSIGSVRFTVVLTTPACPLKEVIRKRCEDAIHTHIGAGIQVTIDMTSDVTSTRANAPTLPGVKNIIAVSSGKGGVGKSTVTANLAIALHRSGAKVGIIDADIYGPSMPTMFGAENIQPRIFQVDGQTRMEPVQQFGIKMLSMGLLVAPWPGHNLARHDGRTGVAAVFLGCRLGRVRLSAHRPATGNGRYSPDLSADGARYGSHHRDHTPESGPGGCHKRAVDVPSATD